MSYRGLLKLAVFGAIAGAPVFAAAQTTLFDNWTPVTDEMLANPADGDWLMWRRNYGNWGYSPLDQINPDNIGDMRLSWAVTLDPGSLEMTPLIHDGVMFMTQACDFTQAVDATNGALLWEYRREVVDHAAGLACGNRNPVLYEDKLFIATHDAFLVALDVRTGEVVWEQQVGDWTIGQHYSGGPQVFNGKLIAGMSGCYYINSRCWISAHDTETGEELWRTYTIPGPGEFGDETWNGVPLEARYGGSAWIAGSYSPELGLIYYGVAVPIPWGSPQRGTGDGDVLYTNSTIALDEDTGEIVWYFQHMANEYWDLDHPFARMVVETAVTPTAGEVQWVADNLTPGETRRVITGIPGKTGIVWTLDAATGDFLWATPTNYQNAMIDVDAANRRGISNPELMAPIGVETFVCPSAGGGINWQTPAYSPQTNAIYAPVNNVCNFYTLNEVTPTIGAHHGSARTRAVIWEGANGNVGAFTAVSVETGEFLWQHVQRAGFGSSVLTTGGGLVVTGDDANLLRVYRATDGEILWEQRVSASLRGYPVTYEVDGTQYIAFPVGGNGRYRARTPEIQFPSGGNMLYVFALPEG
jgi:alcohol dehydrogenase (cytochrome c)